MPPTSPRIPHSRVDLLGLALAVSLHVLESVAPAHAQTAEEIVARHIQARGGAEAIEQVRTVRMSGVIKFPPEMAGPFVSVSVAPSGTRMEFKIEGRPAVQCFDGEHAWLVFGREIETAQGRSVLEYTHTSDDLEIEALRSQEEWSTWPFLYREKGYRLELLESDVGRSFKLRLAKPGGEVDIVHVDRTTYQQILREEQRFNGSDAITRRVYFGDYRDVGGVSMPHSINHVVGDAITELAIREIQLGVPAATCRLSEPEPSGPTERKSIPLKAGVLDPPTALADPEARVGLIIPPQSVDPTWTYTYSGSKVLTLQLAVPTMEGVKKVVCGAFPRCQVAASRDALSEHDLLLEARLRTRPAVRWSQRSSQLVALSVAMQIVMSDADGREIDRLDLNYTARPEKRVVWSEETGARGLGKRAVTEILQSLATRLISSERLDDHLQMLAEARALPPGLEVDIAFDDSAALLPNDRLDAAEIGVLRLAVSNRGPGPAFDAVLRLEAESTGVELATVSEVGSLAAGARKDVEVAIRAHPGLSEGVVRVRVECTDRRGFGARPAVLEISGRALRRPALEIVDVSLLDRGGTTRGDGDGLPGSGERLEAVVRIRNRGPGEATGVVVSLTETPRLKQADRQASIARIAVNEVAEARFDLELPRVLDARELSLSLEAVDGRGGDVAAARGASAWPVVLKAPTLEVARHRLYDGDSPRSSGNRDGRMNNGEQVELALTVVNRGELEARDVRLEVGPLDPEIQAEPAALDLGVLPAGVEGAEQRLRLTVPRRLARRPPSGGLEVPLLLYQGDFPAVSVTVTIPFQFRQPALEVSVEAPETLVQGGSAEVVLKLRNGGDLGAQAVLVEVTSERDGLLLLDERGATRRALTIPIGELAPGSSLRSLQFSVQALRGTPVGEASLRVAVSQSEFSPTEASVPLAISREAAEVVSLVPEAGGPSGRGVVEAAAPALLATISFLEPPFGHHLPAETTTLRFEVQYAGSLAELRLLQNDRAVVLGDPAGSQRVTVGGRSGRADLYEVPLMLEEGENRLEVVAITAEGERTARSHLLHWAAHSGQIWVAAIGIDDYLDAKVPDLKFAEADARAIHAYYRGTLGIPDDRLFLLVGREATLRNVRSLLGTRIAQQATSPQDTVILFFAGHGYRAADPAAADSDGFSKYLLPYDANPDDLYGTAYAMDDVTDVVRRLRPERVVFLVDSCFSGSAGGRTAYDPDRQLRGVVTAEFLERVATSGRGRVVLAASAPNEVAQELRELGHGVFTHYLLEALRGAADENRNGLVDADEAYRYVSERVHGATGGQQTPWRKFSAAEAIGQIVIGRSVHEGETVPGRPRK